MEITSYFGTWQIQVIVILIAIDVLLGLIAALVKKTFLLGKVADFMKVSYVFGFIVIEIIGDELPQINFIVLTSFVLIVITLLSSIFKNLAKLGIPIPSDLKK